MAGIVGMIGVGSENGDNIRVPDFEAKWIIAIPLAIIGTPALAAARYGEQIHAAFETQVVAGIVGIVAFGLIGLMIATPRARPSRRRR